MMDVWFKKWCCSLNIKKALYTHCYGHSLNLACSDTTKQSKIIRNSLDSVLETTKLVKKYPRRESIL